jgi:hypothetical protein
MSNFRRSNETGHASGKRPWTPVAACCCLVTCLLAGCGTRAKPAAPPAGPIVFRDVTQDARLAFRHTIGGSGECYIVESVSAGLALFDYDGDGLIDIYFLNGAPLRGARADVPPTNALFRNEGGWRFRDVSEEAGVADRGYGLGVTVGDYDNDGDPDLYLNNYGPNVLYRNNNDGTFTDVTKQAGVGNGHEVGAGACFLDVDLDGDLDLYVSNYVDFTYENHVPCSLDGFPAYAGPRLYNPVPDVLYRNNGDATFTDISMESGIGEPRGTGMGVVAADYDHDGDTDVFVCNDGGRNFLFQNDGTGKFEEVAAIAGTSFNGFGDVNASMGVDCGDYNNDGLLDFFMTNYVGELPVLYENVGNGFFDDVTRRTRSGIGALPHVTWGLGLVDFDNDGDRDIYVACGHLDDKVGLRDDTMSYRARNILQVNNGDGSFTSVSDQAGDGLSPKHSSRGAAFDDLDNDGQIDVVVLNSDESPTIIRNETNSSDHWIQIRLRGRKANRDGIGAQVQVVAGELVQIDEVHSGRAYQSHFGTRLHFGLGPHARVDRIEVHWLGGGVDVVQNLAADQCVTLIERAD